MEFTFKLRRDVAADWTAANPILLEGEPGVEIDTNKFKIGDGIHFWNDLKYFVDLSVVQALIDALVLDTGAVVSIFGRSGVVTAQTGDYTKAQVGLGNVDNTTDLNKPISTATQAALDGKAATSHTHPVPPATVVLTDAATISVDATLGERFRVTLTGDHTLGNPTGAVDGQMLLFEIIQDGAGGQALTLGTKFNDPNGYFTGQSTAANKRDKLGVQYNSAADKFDVLAFAAGF